MKSLVFSFLLSITFPALAQEVIVLEQPEKWDTIPRGKAIIYGTFLQNIGKKADGNQYVRLFNNDTKKMYSMPVVTKMIAGEKNQFICVVPPGQYSIIDYRYAVISPHVMDIHRTKHYISPIVADTLSADSTKTNRINFNISVRTLNYVGTWDLRDHQASFSENKTEADAEWKKYKKLDFSKAAISIPAPARGFRRY